MLEEDPRLRLRLRVRLGVVAPLTVFSPSSSVRRDEVLDDDLLGGSGGRDERNVALCDVSSSEAYGSTSVGKRGRLLR